MATIHIMHVIQVQWIGGWHLKPEVTSSTSAEIRRVSMGDPNVCQDHGIGGQFGIVAETQLTRQIQRVVGVNQVAAKLRRLQQHLITPST